MKVYRFESSYFFCRLLGKSIMKNQWRILNFRYGRENNRGVTRINRWWIKTEKNNWVRQNDGLISERYWIWLYFLLVSKPKEYQMIFDFCFYLFPTISNMKWWEWLDKSMSLFSFSVVEYFYYMSLWEKCLRFTTHTSW